MVHRFFVKSSVEERLFKLLNRQTAGSVRRLVMHKQCLHCTCARNQAVLVEFVKYSKTIEFVLI